jgi:hypothetical protein
MALIYGALNYNISDWDVGISLIMALLNTLPPVGTLPGYY